MAEITLVKGETSALDRSGSRDLSAAWARLPAGGMLRLEWPLPRAALSS